MIIDIIYAVLIVLAVIKGYSRGLIVGIFSLVAIIVGLAAAIKLSAVVAGYIGSAVNISDRWLPIISFIVVFILVLVLIRLGAKAIEKAVEIALLGWLNKLGGILLYIVIYTIIFSILLFYAEQVRLIKTETIEASVSYSFIQPWGPKAINSLGTVLPFFRDMFTQLEHFFDGIARDISLH